MALQPLPDMAHNITRVLQQRGKAYLTLRQVITGLPARLRRELGLTPRLATAEVLNKITPFLGDSLQVYRGTTTIYIGQKHSPDEFLLQQLQQQPGISPKQLGLRLPLSKQTYLMTLNALLETGTVVCTFKDTHIPALQMARSIPTLAMAQHSVENERAAFLAAYQEVGQGRSFVRIHRLRDTLPWPRERFDRALEALAADYTIELHGGDPSVMTAEELRQSFTAADGILYIALSWRGKT